MFSLCHFLLISLSLMIFQFWAFSDIQTGKVLMRVPAGDAANNGEVKLLLSLLTLYCWHLIWLNLMLCSIMYPLVFWESLLELTKSASELSDVIEQTVHAWVQSKDFLWVWQCWKNLFVRPVNLFVWPFSMSVSSPRSSCMNNIPNFGKKVKVLDIRKNMLRIQLFSKLQK